MFANKSDSLTSADLSPALTACLQPHLDAASLCAQSYNFALHTGTLVKQTSDASSLCASRSVEGARFYGVTETCFREHSLAVTGVSMRKTLTYFVLVKLIKSAKASNFTPASKILNHTRGCFAFLARGDHSV